MFRNAGEQFQGRDRAALLCQGLLHFAVVTHLFRRFRICVASATHHACSGGYFCHPTNMPPTPPTPCSVASTVKSYSSTFLCDTNFNANRGMEGASRAGRSRSSQWIWSVRPPGFGATPCMRNARRSCTMTSQPDAWDTSWSSWKHTRSYEQCYQLLSTAFPAQGSLPGRLAMVAIPQKAGGILPELMPIISKLRGSVVEATGEVSVG